MKNHASVRLLAFALSVPLAVACSGPAPAGDDPTAESAFSTAPTRLAASKIGMQILGVSSGAGATAIDQMFQACPRVVKWMLNDGVDDATRLSQMKGYKSHCPGGQIVLRVYVPSQVVSWNGAGDVNEAVGKADAFWNAMKAQWRQDIFTPQLVDWVEGPNEIDNWTNYDPAHGHAGWYWNDAHAAEWYGWFWDHLAELMVASGYHPLIGSIAVGNPALPGEWGYAATSGGGFQWVASVIRAKRAKGYTVGWSYHNYGDQLFDPSDEQHNVLRYRTIRDANGLGGVPIVLTEGGQDGAQHGWVDRGTNPDFFEAFLERQDKLLQQDAEVLGSTLYAWGNPGLFGAGFDIAPLGTRLSSYVANNVGLIFRDISTQLAGGDWDKCHGKAACAGGDYIAGLSVDPGDHQGRSALCRRGTSQFSGTWTRTLLADHACTGSPVCDQRAAARGAPQGNGSDWDFGFAKLECGPNEFVVSVSEDASVCGAARDGFHGIACAVGGFTASGGAGCHTKLLGTPGQDGANGAGDWDYGGFKTECGANEFMAGVSLDVGTRAPHAVLCCAR